MVTLYSFIYEFAVKVDGGLDYGGWDESVYTISPYSTGNVWKHYYSVGSNNLMLAIKNAEESEPVNHNAIAQCKILLAEHMYGGNDVVGEIFLSQNPGTEQLNIRNLILRKVY